MNTALLVPLLGCLTLGQFDEADEPPRTAYVSVASLLVLEEPDDAAYVTGRLKRGERVVVRREGPAGWIAIEPPNGAFSWVEESAVTDLGNGRARVRVEAAAVRPGSDVARLPGGRWVSLPRGQVVRLLDRPPLVLRGSSGTEPRTWLAVEPPRGELRYVRADGVGAANPSGLAEGARSSDEPADFNFARIDGAVSLDDGRTRSDRPGASAASGSGRSGTGGGRRAALASGGDRRLTGVPLDASFARVGPPLPEFGISPRFATDLRRAESTHRAVLAQPIESWRFDVVRRDYQVLLDQAASPEEKGAVQARLDQTDRQAAVARSAAALAEALARSRRLDAEVAAIHERLSQIAGQVDAPYDAQGLLHNSAKLVEGKPVLILIGDDGFPIAYLAIPPGLDASALVGSRVGVRGDSRFNEPLRSRLIQVRDLDPLDRRP